MAKKEENKVTRYKLTNRIIPIIAKVLFLFFIGVKPFLNKR